MGTEEGERESFHGLVVVDNLSMKTGVGKGESLQKLVVVKFLVFLAVGSKKSTERINGMCALKLVCDSLRKSWARNRFHPRRPRNAPSNAYHHNLSA